MASSTSQSDDSHREFVRALARHEPAIRAYIRGAFPRPEDVDEIMQNVSLIAWAKFDQLRDVEDFPKWATVIARYEILKHRRTLARDRLVLSEELLDLVAREAVEEAPVREEQLRHLETCLDQLPEPRRKLLLQAYSPGVSMRDLARQTGKTENAFYQFIWRLRKNLADCIEAERTAASPA